MNIRTHWPQSLLALAAFACVCLTTAAALAADEPPNATGHPLVDTVFAYVGMLVTALSLIGAVLPRQWRATQLLARFTADLRGILTPDPSDDPDWARRSKSDSSVMMILLAALGVPGCAVWQDTLAPAAAACLPDRQYVIQGLSSILRGDDAFDVLDRLKNEKGAELVLCALQQFLERVAVTPETAPQRQRARAYLERS